MCIGVHGLPTRIGSLTENGPGFTGKCNQRPGLHTLQACYLRHRKELVLSDKVKHLAADHSVGTSRLRQLGDKIASNPRIGMCRRVGKHAERPGEQRIACKNRRGLVELYVTRRKSTTHIIIVHGRKIVVDQRIAVNHLDCRRDPQSAGFVHTEQLSARNDQEWTDPLATREARVSNGLHQPRSQFLMQRQQRIQHFVYVARSLRKGRFYFNQLIASVQIRWLAGNVSI